MSNECEAIWTAAVDGDWETVKQLLEREPSLIDVTGEVFFETLIDDDGEEYDEPVACGQPKLMTSSRYY